MKKKKKLSFGLQFSTRYLYLCLTEGVINSMKEKKGRTKLDHPKNKIKKNLYTSIPNRT